MKKFAISIPCLTAKPNHYIQFNLRFWDRVYYYIYTLVVVSYTFDYFVQLQHIVPNRGNQIRFRGKIRSTTINLLISIFPLSSVTVQHIVLLLFPTLEWWLHVKNPFTSTSNRKFSIYMHDLFWKTSILWDSDPLIGFVYLCRHDRAYCFLVVCVCVRVLW